MSMRLMYQDKSKRLIYVKGQKQIFLFTFAPNTNVFFFHFCPKGLKLVKYDIKCLLINIIKSLHFYIRPILKAGRNQNVRNGANEDKKNVSEIY